jgi:hypothetical protein
MAIEANIRLPDELLAQVQRVTRNGETADDLAAIAVKREVARRLLAKLPDQSSGMTEEQEMETVVKAVHDYRRGR